MVGGIDGVADGEIGRTRHVRLTQTRGSGFERHGLKLEGWRKSKKA